MIDRKSYIAMVAEEAMKNGYIPATITAEEHAEVIAYAEQRGVRVTPEVKVGSPGR